jgi:hypothetical protein
MSRPTEVKVKGASVGALVAGAVIAVFNAVTTNSSVLGGLPSWLQFLILTLAPTVVAWLGGYVTPSTTSSTSDAYKPPAA